MNMRQRGSTTIQISVKDPTKDRPKGGVYNRLEKLMLYKRETWDEVLERVLDFCDTHHDEYVKFEALHHVRK